MDFRFVSLTLSGAPPKRSGWVYLKNCFSLAWPAALVLKELLIDIKRRLLEDKRVYLFM